MLLLTEQPKHLVMGEIKAVLRELNMRGRCSNAGGGDDGNEDAVKKPFFALYECGVDQRGLTLDIVE